MPLDWIFALIGGALIGISVSLMLALKGRVTGISGIIHGSFLTSGEERKWRLMFILGLLLGGLFLNLINPQLFSGQLEGPLWTLVAAGLLVGFGTVMGNGCTSGHGVCGISRFSLRSLLATLTFMAAGILSVYIFRQLGGLI